MTVVEGRHVRAQVRSRLAGMAVVGDIIESLIRGGADRGHGRLGPRVIGHDILAGKYLAKYRNSLI